MVPAEETRLHGLILALTTRLDAQAEVLGRIENDLAPVRGIIFAVALSVPL